MSVVTGKIVRSTGFIVVDNIYLLEMRKGRTGQEAYVIDATSHHKVAVGGAEFKFSRGLWRFQKADNELTNRYVKETLVIRSDHTVKLTNTPISGVLFSERLLESGSYDIYTSSVSGDIVTIEPDEGESLVGLQYQVIYSVSNSSLAGHNNDTPVDTLPTLGSDNFVSSNGIFNAIKEQSEKLGTLPINFDNLSETNNQIYYNHIAKTMDFRSNENYVTFDENSFSNNLVGRGIKDLHALVTYLDLYNNPTANVPVIQQVLYRPPLSLKNVGTIFRVTSERKTWMLVSDTSTPTSIDELEYVLLGALNAEEVEHLPEKSLGILRREFRLISTGVIYLLLSTLPEGEETLESLVWRKK